MLFCKTIFKYYEPNVYTYDVCIPDDPDDFSIYWYGEFLAETSRLIASVGIGFFSTKMEAEEYFNRFLIGIYQRNQ